MHFFKNLIREIVCIRKNLTGRRTMVRLVVVKLNIMGNTPQFYLKFKGSSPLTNFQYQFFFFVSPDCLIELTSQNLFTLKKRRKIREKCF